MKFVDSLRSTIRNANDSLATAKKSWHDENLSQREQKAIEEEQRLTVLHAQLQAEASNIARLNKERDRRRFFSVILFISTAVLSFALGFAVRGGTASGVNYYPPRSIENESAALPTDSSTKAVPSHASKDIQSPASDASLADPVAQCTARGVSYFKEIGSYPLLQAPPQKGREAEAVARERCSRTTTAF